MSDDRPATEPRTEAGRTTRDLLVGLFRSWEEVAELKGIEVGALHEDPTGLILAIEEQAGEKVLADLLSKGYTRAEAAQGAAPLDDTECICASLAASDLRSLRWQREFGFDPLCPVDHDPRPEGAAPRAEGLPDDRTCLTHPRQVPHDWLHQSYEGTWLCHCTVCGIVPNRAEGLDTPCRICGSTEAGHMKRLHDEVAASRPSDERVPESEEI